jgi:uncharacterized membrane protein YdjX (TVP38/TMEM64 family)
VSQGSISKNQLWLRLAILVLLGLVFIFSGAQNQISIVRLRAIGANPFTAFLIVLVMTAAWAFALPGSAFFFVTPFLYSPLASTVILTIGCATGTTAGYIAARYVGGPWVEPYKDLRITKFLRRHSSFAMVFAVRVFPGSQHGIINYSAGILKLPFGKFFAATVLGVAIKAFLYSVALQGSVQALSIRDALNLPTALALITFAAIGLGGHIVMRRWERDDAKNEAANSAS